MKINFLLIAFIIVIISSCSTSYKTGQTPDDVYYSPAHFEYDSVRTDRRADNTVYDNSEDREIRRRVSNRRYRRYDDRYDTRYDGYNYPYGYNTYPPVYSNPKFGTQQNTNKPRKTNLGAYNPIRYDSFALSNSKTGKLNGNGTTAPVRTFGNSSNNGTAVGNFLRKIAPSANSDNNSNNNYNRSNSDNSSTRTFDTRTNNTNQNNSTNSSAPAITNSGSAPVRTFKKDN